MMPFNDYGSYLVRDSETNPGDYLLCVRDREQQVRHYRIRQLDDGGFFITMRVTFNTVQDLVAYYQMQADGLCTNLIKPCVLSEEPGDLSKQTYKEWEVDGKTIKFVRKLMFTDAWFVEKWKGVWNGTTPVIVKTPRPGKIAIGHFLRAANLMKKIQHQNIIQFYDVCTKEESMYIVTELMKHGSLLEYLRGEGRSLKPPQLIDMAMQVAQGMAYLEEHTDIIHRNLAARNILVGENLICKVANFEMAQEIDEDIYETPSGVNTKWTAPEALVHNRFTIKSDVWSFGVVLYEIITYGHVPYPGRTDNQVLKHVQQGYRIPQPRNCPYKIYNIMLNCWREEPENRPLFEALQWQLEEFI